MASAISRCSVEMKSSFISAAMSVAVLSTCSAARAYDGAPTVLPLAAGSRPSSARTPASTVEGCTPTACSNGRTMPSGSASSAASRCTASTCAWPADADAEMALLMASWLRVVNFDASMR